MFSSRSTASKRRRAPGADIIDLGMGNPDLAAPKHVIDKLVETAGRPRTDRYSASKGIAGLRRAQAYYYEKRFNVRLNPDTQIVATLGSKKALQIWRKRLLRRAMLFSCQILPIRSMLLVF